MWKAKKPPDVDAALAGFAMESIQEPFEFGIHCLAINLFGSGYSFLNHLFAQIAERQEFAAISDALVAKVMV